MKYWLLILLVTLITYGSSLRYSFSQDDYYFLLISQANSFKEVLQFFSPWHQQGFVFFRPLGTQLYFYLFQQNAWAMHIFMLLVQSINGYLVMRLVERLKAKSPASLLVGVLYAASAAHFLSLFYIAATQQLLAATFSLISLITFVDKKYWTSALLLIPGLLSKETAIITPAIAALLYQLGHKKFEIKKVLPLAVPYIAVGAVYVILRLASGITVQSEYHPVIGPSIISTLRWYWLFGYSAPEELMRYSGAYLFVNFFRFIRDFGTVALVSTLATIVAALTAIGIAIKSVTLGQPLSRLKITVYMLWFLVGIVLVIFYPHHRYPHYLDLGLIPLLLIIIEGVGGKWRYIFSGLLLVGSLAAINISRDAHWTTGRAEMAERARVFFDEKHICDYDSVRFTGEDNAPQELSYTLSLENGPTVMCEHPVRVRYGQDPGFTEGTFDISRVVQP